MRMPVSQTACKVSRPKLLGEIISHMFFLVDADGNVYAGCGDGVQVRLP
jgi:hypothetical protein